jgi:hypothetical protein
MIPLGCGSCSAGFDDVHTVARLDAWGVCERTVQLPLAFGETRGRVPLDVRQGGFAQARCVRACTSLLGTTIRLPRRRGLSRLEHSPRKQGRSAACLPGCLLWDSKTSTW